MKLSVAVQGFILNITSEGYASATIESYQRFLIRWVRFLDDPNVEAITEDNIRSFYSHLRTAGLAAVSIQAYWRTVRSFYNWAEQKLHLERPDKGIKAFKSAPAHINSFTKDEVERILKACGRSKRNHALVLFLLDTGLRVSEACRLSVQDCDIESGAITVRAFQTGRKSRPRLVYIGKSTRHALWLYLASRPDAHPGDPLFSTLNGKPLNRFSVKNILYRLAASSGVPKVHPHRFRHTMAIEYLRSGGDVFTLQRLLGHANLEMVRYYLDLAESDSATAHRRASPVDNWRV